MVLGGCSSGPAGWRPGRWLHRNPGAPLRLVDLTRAVTERPPAPRKQGAGNGDAIGAAQLRRIAAAGAKVRARMWRLLGGPPPARAAGRDIGEQVVVLDIDSTIVLAHSDKDGPGRAGELGLDRVELDEQLRAGVVEICQIPRGDVVALNRV